MPALALVLALLTLAGGGAQAALPAPARGLAFERNGDLYIANADGSGVRNLTRTRNVSEHAPAWSPRGDRLAYVGYRDGNAEIYVSRADGSRSRRLTRHAAEDLAPAWSPDGRRLAFASNRGGAFDVYAMSADGTGVRRVTRLGRADRGSFSPAWSPDGRLIAFASSGPTPDNLEVYSVRPDGTGLRRLTRTQGGVHTLGDDGTPAWSPDGATIAFTSNRTGGGDIWTMRPDGGEQRRLAGLPGRDDALPRYSPDGAWIAFESRRLGRSNVYAVRADGSGLRLLLRNAAAPSWRP